MRADRERRADSHNHRGPPTDQHIEVVQKCAVDASAGRSESLPKRCLTITTSPIYGQDYNKRGFDGRFGAGLPRVNDGSPLFLQHMIDKLEPVRPTEHKHGSPIRVCFLE